MGGLVKMGGFVKPYTGYRSIQTELMTCCFSGKQKISTFFGKYSIPISMFRWIMTQSTILENILFV